MKSEGELFGLQSAVEPSLPSLPRSALRLPNGLISFLPHGVGNIDIVGRDPSLRRDYAVHVAQARSPGTLTGHLLLTLQVRS